MRYLLGDKGNADNQTKCFNLTSTYAKSISQLNFIEKKKNHLVKKYIYQKKKIKLNLIKDKNVK